MILDMDIITSNALVIVPIVIALTQAIKLTGFIPDHFAPLLSILIGVLIGLIANHDSVNFTSTLLTGVIYGLMASGLYSGVKTTMVANNRIKAKREKKRETDN